MVFEKQDRDLLQGVQSNVIIPSHSDLALKDLLKTYPDVEQRSVLYFDESLRVLVVLDFPACPEERLNRYLQKLELRVDAWSVSLQKGEEKSSANGSSAQDLIASQEVENLNDPITLIQQDTVADKVRIQLIWELTLPLGRPRTRAVDQSIIFVPIAIIDGSTDGEDRLENLLLEPYVALEPNLLEPYGPLPEIEHPFFPLSNLTRIPPASPTKDGTIRLKSQASEPFSSYVAALPRLKYNKIDVSRSDPITISCLDLEIIPYGDLHGQIGSIDISLAGGTVDCLMPDSLPMACKSRDSITFLHRLHSASQSGTSTPTGSAITSVPSLANPNIDILTIQILVHLFLAPHTTATIRTSWTTNVDFSSALNPAFGAPSQTLQRTNRPDSLSLASQSDSSKSQGRPKTDAATLSNTKMASTSLQHQMIPSSIIRRSTSSMLSISFSAPEQPIHIGVPFSWRVLIVNNSPKTVRLAIVPLPRIQRPPNPNQHYAKRHAPKASNSSLLPVPVLQASAGNVPRGSSRDPRGGSTARAVVEENILYALHHQASSAGVSAIPAEADIISLTAELRIGPLGAKQCHETEIKFIAYKGGIFAVDAIRVVDLTSEGEGNVGTVMDIGELPEVIVVEEHIDE